MVDFVQQHAVFHRIFWVTSYQLTFQLEHHHGNRLVHLGCKCGVYRVELVFVQHMGHKASTGVIGVGRGGKHGQRTQIDAVPVL